MAALGGLGHQLGGQRHHEHARAEGDDAGQEPPRQLEEEPDGDADRKGRGGQKAHDERRSHPRPSTPRARETLPRGAAWAPSADHAPARGRRRPWPRRAAAPARRGCGRRVPRRSRPSSSTTASRVGRSGPRRHATRSTPLRLLGCGPAREGSRRPPRSGGARDAASAPRPSASAPASRAPPASRAWRPTRPPRPTSQDANTVGCRAPARSASRTAVSTSTEV